MNFRRNPAGAVCAAVALLTAMISTTFAQPKWSAKTGPLMTRWSKEVSPDNALPDYPRPQMVRAKWMNLNGLWDYAITDKDAVHGASAAAQWDGQILVPYPIESALSGVMKRVSPEQRLWYRRSFKLPADWAKDTRVLLHFGAVDWDATVSVNGREVIRHKGGFDPFTIDVTDALKPDHQAEQELTVSVWDPTDAGTQPRGKQVREPHGIWYTPVTGIWQSVWLEPVPVVHAHGLRIVPDIDKSELRLTVVAGKRGEGASVHAVVLSQGKSIAEADGHAGKPLTLKIANPHLWSPDSPFLYDLRVTTGDDTVTSYFGMRKTSIGKDEHGLTRLMLNNKFVFQFGPLDQGWWPDGLYTAPTDEALKYDIEMTRKLGFNMCRKHTKVEPARWYYWADKLGLLVWQDMPTGDKIAGRHGKEIERTKESADQFELELHELINDHRNHPCIVVWVPFNESWGQFDTARIAKLVKKLDPTRVVDSVSGWIDMGVGDLRDYHIYPGPGSPKPEAHRAAVLGEFGGLGLPISGHTWQSDKNWGYKRYADKDALQKDYLHELSELAPLIAVPGLSAAVYTQTTDVEGEVNGLLTYDRAICKMDPELLHRVHQEMIHSPPKVEQLVPTGKESSASWHYTTHQPASDWYASDFDDSSWKTGPGGFGVIGQVDGMNQAGKPDAFAQTQWNGPEIWVRRIFHLDDTHFSDPRLVLHHDNAAEIYLNGQRIYTFDGYTRAYALIALDKNARELLRGGSNGGSNVLAIHCKSKGEMRYLDAGLWDVQGGPKPPAREPGPAMRMEKH
jgi:hypothetical protein